MIDKAMLQKRGEQWVWTGGFATKDVPKAAGFRWDPDRKLWWTKFADVAAKLVNYAEGEVKTELEAHLNHKEASIQASKAVSAELDIPAPNGLAYMPFQKAGVAFALARKNTLLADAMGLGKTIQAIGVINATDIKRVLVVCPATLKGNWARELHKWLTRPLTVGIVNGEWPQTQIVIVNYDVLTKWEKHTKAQEWDLLIVDEVHRVKNPNAQRTKQVLGEKDKQGNWTTQPIPAKRKLFLTGTPIVNRPIELWPLVSTLAPETFSSFWGFARRYCDASQGRYGWDLSGASNLSELQEKLRSTVMVRRLKSEVLKELPAKVRQVIEIPANGCNGVVAAEQSAIQGWEDRLADLRTAVELSKASDNEDEYKAAVDALKEGAQAAFTEMAKLRHDTAVAKIPSVIDHLEDALESGKVVVFAHHHDVVHALAEKFGAMAVVLTGETKMSERQGVVDRFQTDPNVKLFIGGITAAGVGITLTAASHVVFAELDWVPGNVTQAEDRLHRIGQENSLLVQHLVLEGSLDARIAKTIVEKQEVIDKALDKEIEKTPIIPVGIASTESVSRKQVQEAVFTEEQVKAIHLGLRMLSGVCDGAIQLDGVGFNKLDTGIGKRLADLESLTQKQAALGKVLVNRYRRQLPQELLQEAL